MIKTLLKNPPENYDRLYTEQVKGGARVLALAIKELTSESRDSV
jgi:hypothetical protein